MLNIRKTIFGDNMHVEILLKQIRKERNLSLRDLERMTGISKSHLNSIENNEKEASLSMMVRISLALNIDIKDLYEVSK